MTKKKKNRLKGELSNISSFSIPKENRLQGKLSNGFSFSIPMERLNDYALFDLITEMDDDPLLFPKVVTLLFGDQKKEFLDCLRDEEGHIPIERVTQALEELFSSGEVLKN